jgi:hypothetical protein
MIAMSKDLTISCVMYLYCLVIHTTAKSRYISILEGNQGSPSTPPIKFLLENIIKRNILFSNLNEDLIGLPNLMIKPNISEIDNEFELFITPDIEKNYYN